jgi:hypothetical protein
MNDLYYGNLNKSFLPYLDIKNEFTQYFDEFSMIPFPNFYESLQENEFIMSVQEKAEQSAEWDKVKNFCFLWDAELIESLKTSLSKLGIPHDDSYIDYLTTITEDLGALIMQLKNHYQRARPYQYAFYGNQKLHPYDTFSGITPSYPSGHATQTYFLCKVIATHYEEKAKELDALAKRVADSRVIMGVHFPSDNEFGINIAQSLLEKQDIIAKYLE